jgi:hypothetical protein
MKGLELAELYYRSHAVPMIRQRYPAYVDRIAAGLVGDGSDCLGFDDAYSRDHDWGPGFCLWLGPDDFQQIGEALQRDYLALPSSFSGFRRQNSTWGNGRVGVFEIGQFYRGFIGRAAVPGTLGEWFRIPEKNLAACTNGKVFDDPAGGFSRFRNALLAFYPRDVRLAKIAARCMSAGQSGQYNLLRCVRRDDHFAAHYAETKFCADMLSLVYLINRRYAPYYKWLQKGSGFLPRLGPFMQRHVAELVKERSTDGKMARIDLICAAVISELRGEGLSDCDSRFLVDHGPAVHDKIEDPGLRATDVWAG